MASQNSLTAEEKALFFEDQFIKYANEKKNPLDVEKLCRILALRTSLLSLCHLDNNDPTFLQHLQSQFDDDACNKNELDIWKKFAKVNATLSPEESPWNSYEVDVDAFFEEYPGEIDEQLDNESSDDEDRNTKEALETKTIPAVSTAPSSAQTTFPPPAPINPYSANNAFSSVQNPPQSTPADVPLIHKSWDQYHQQNPFQTARELSMMTKDEPLAQSDPPENTQQRGFNPYQQAPMPPPPEQPIIRDSLKRKFQPPKRDVQGGSTKTSATGGKSGLSQKAPTDNVDANEDDLPEELKRFGKEMVDKIESEILDSGDPITFDDIAGLYDAKQTIQEVICWPMKRPDLFTGLRRAPNGLLLYGPPGTGKTLIAKAIAHESGATFFSISSSALTSKWIGEGEKLVRTLFAVAGYRQPSVVFIDEIDSLLTQRKADENEASRRMKTEFLVQLDGTGTSGQGQVLIIGATNRPQELDDAVRRRFVKRLYIPLPVESDREVLLRVLLGKNKHQLQDHEIKKLATETDGYSGADLKALCMEAAMEPIRQLGARALEVDVNDVPPISFKHFRVSLRGMKPSVAPSDLHQYEEWDKVYGSKRASPCNGEDDDEEN